MLRRLPAIILVSLACLAWSLTCDVPVASAQAVTGSIFGTVIDNGGARIPGTTVTVASAQLIQGQESGTTGEQGGYRFANLPPGTYSVTFELQGFQAVKHPGILLLSGQSLAVDVTLEVARISETVTVTGESPVVDTRSSALVNTRDSATLESVPLGRSYVQILGIMPGVTDTKYNFSPVVVVHGGSVRDNIYSLDGINTNDSATGATSTMLSVDIIQEVQITTAGIPAEYGNASGAAITYVTKSGGDAFKGGAAAYYQSKDTQSNNLSDALRQQGLTVGTSTDHLYDSGVVLGGPIRKSKAWFFANYRYLDTQQRVPDFRAPLGNADHQAFVKATVQVSTSSTLGLSFDLRNHVNFPYTDTASFANSGDSRTWMALRRQNYGISPRWRTVINNRTFFEAVGGIGIYALSGEDPNNDGSPAYQDSATGIISGGDFHAIGRNRRDLHQAKADLSHFRENWLGGSHSFKTGFGWQVGPLLYQQYYQGARGPDELVGCSERCISQTPDTVHLLFNGAPFRVRLYNSPVFSRAAFRTWDAYVQDQWVIRDRVTLNLGARVDQASGDLLDRSVGGGAWDPLVTFPTVSGVMKFTTLSPRSGLVWDVTGHHNTTVKGSAGRFYGQALGQWVRNVDPAQFGYREYDWVDRSGDRVYQVGEETLLRADTRANPKALPTVDPNLRNQYVDVYTIGFERQFGSDWSVATTGVFKRDGDLVGLVNGAVPFSSYNPITVTNPLNGQPLQIFTLRPEFLGVPGQNIMTNPGTRAGDTVPLRRKYDGVEFVLSKRMRNKWQMQTSYVLGNAQGNVSNSFAGSGQADYRNPNALINLFGAEPLDIRHQFKLYGSYEAPYGLLFSGFFQVLSGLPLLDNFNSSGQETPRGATVVRFFKADNPQILSETFIDVAVEPAGTRRFDTQTNLDLRVEKKFLRSVSLIADVFNVFNRNTITRIQSLRLDQFNYLRPAETQYPRQLRVGLKWDF